MNEVDLKKRAEELEKTLQLQLAQLKENSQTWLKVAAAIVAVGLIATAVAKRGRKKRSKRGYINDAIQEPVHQIQKRSKAASFFPPLKKRLLLALFSLGQAKLMAELKKRKAE
ncbi:MAG TPA: hypothetical protein VKX33_09085 [Cyclobacteriaceae bacterium]|nr:hypothetical protein [Cyclobacteriaceae bacterium]